MSDSSASWRRERRGGKFSQRICSVLLAGVLIGVMVVPGRGLQAVTRSRDAGISFPAQGRARKPLGEHYLMLVNTAIASQMNAAKLAQFDKSPYDGLAVAFLHAYDTSAVPTAAQVTVKLNEWKQSTHKDLWPWVYINRIVAADPEEKTGYESPYFQRLRGADLEGSAGALTDFLQHWRNSLQAAEATGAPGVVCDLEFYNSHRAYDVRVLAAQMGRSPDEAARLLRGIGARMAQIAAAEDPDAVLWFLFTGFSYAQFRGGAYFPAPAYVAMGLLEEIKARGLRLQVISGGEGSLAYCHSSVEDLREKIRVRGAKFGPQLQSYAGILELGGTMTLWSDLAAKRGWVNDGACRTAPAQNVEDLQPYLELLLSSYRYNWIYASVDGGYNAFLPPSAARFDAVISRAKARAAAGPAH